MEKAPPSRKCPACGSKDYTFRSRRQIEADPEKGEPAQLETKYRCKGCGEEWKDRVPGVLQKAPPRE
jgi:DNA-directed RNA polymerase subunit M/transcription elongation factor TFIIS